MTTTEFNKRVHEIAEKYGYKYDGSQTICEYTKETRFGLLSFRPSPIPKIGLYTVTMKFPTFFDYRNFNDVYGLTQGNRLWSRKWNIHNSDFDYVLTELDERLDNIDYLTKNN